MDLRAELSYPGASAAAVFALAVDVGFRVAVCKATMAVDYDVDVQVEDDGTTKVRLSRSMPAEVPDFVKRLVGETIDVVQTETWSPDDGSGRFSADLSLDVVGQPATLRGSLLIEDGPDGAVEVVQGTIKVSMPFIGRKFESELSKAILAAARREEELGRAWLAA